MEPHSAASRPTNYWDYIRVEELLTLQRGLARDEREISRDEILFVTVHQVYELWFKLVLNELRCLRDLFKQPRVEEQALSSAARAIGRVQTILRVAAHHFEVVETLTTREYLAFRDKLTPASGFQSAQLRQIEILLGLSETERVPLGTGTTFLEALRAHDGSESMALRRVRAQIADRPSLKDAVEDWLHRTPIDGVGPEDAGDEANLLRFVGAYQAAHARELDHTCALALERTQSEKERADLRARYEAEKRSLHAFLHPGPAEGGARRARLRGAALFILSYRELPLLAWPREILDGLVELEEVLVIFRQRHARMVERVIGRRTGTGGSSGVDYLDETARAYRVFRDLWAIRTYQIRRDAIPPLERAQFYDFRNG
jgi:tryptophan 2,3-dioxygenase